MAARVIGSLGRWPAGAGNVAGALREPRDLRLRILVDPAMQIVGRRLAHGGPTSVHLFGLVRPVPPDVPGTVFPDTVPRYRGYHPVCPPPSQSRFSRSTRLILKLVDLLRGYRFS